MKELQTDKQQIDRWLSMIKRVYGENVEMSARHLLEIDPSLQFREVLTKAQEEVYGDQIKAGSHFFRNVKIGEWELDE